ncbi:hypothetical protein ACFWBH_30425 [Streptomyces sp. NPDC059999]|uniref:hypothetical protein n=1 Tax=Streptomyces sp. NPDC059999 TaxID=3347030 RepID=UPI0036B38A28
MTTATGKSIADDLRKLVDDIPHLAAEYGLNPLAAVPGPEASHVLLEEDLVNAGEFIALAHRCDARILYYDHDVFTADDFVSLVDDDPLTDGPTREEKLSPEDARQLARLSRAASRRAGHVTVVIMCFMTDGLPHMWISRAAWHTKLTAERDLFLEACASAPRNPAKKTTRPAGTQNSSA